MLIILNHAQNMEFVLVWYLQPCRLIEAYRLFSGKWAWDYVRILSIGQVCENLQQENS